MATFHYPDEPTIAGWPFPANSGVFLCTTTAVDGTGTRSNGVLLTYRGSKQIGRYRDAVVWLPLGRSAPVTEVGQYDYQTAQISFAFPPIGTDYNGSSSVTRATVESRLDAMMTALQSGNFIEYQDSRGRVLRGTLSSDFVYKDEPVGWESVEGTIVEVAAG